MAVVLDFEFSDFGICNNRPYCWIWRHLKLQHFAKIGQSFNKLWQKNDEQQVSNVSVQTLIGPYAVQVLRFVRVSPAAYNVNDIHRY